ncbi:hypothetical protein BpHYR1_006525 [Brachionus plicatilis]|uniref:SWIM-type domain-containing protein n=1 Tax=Brachionus plicatilis TaxID=10195 RepID=A0A3M7PKR1_BRAPC|nr:hypothetical protein BpHYR1_006525 [Brachionus plicatilis]
MRAKWFSSQGLIYFCSQTGTLNIKDENNNVFMVRMNPITTCTCEKKIDCVYIVAVQISLGVYDLSKPKKKKFTLSKLQGKKYTKSGRKNRANLDEIVTIGPSVSIGTVGLQNGLSSSQSQLLLSELKKLKKKDKRVLLLVLINKEFDFSCKIKEEMLLTMPENVPKVP